MEETSKQPDQQTTTTTVVRNINHLPLPPATLYSPYSAFDFDGPVIDYCRNRNNHLIHSSHKPAKSKVGSYNAINAPFNKIVRSCKVVVSGDVAIGKTCLINRFGHDIYSNKYQTTIGVDFDLQKFNILNQSYVLQIWDTAGLERFKCITNSYYRGCQVALLVFDMSNLSTLANVLRWKDEVLSSSRTFDQMSNVDIQTFQETPLLFLVGTKSDLPLTDSSRSFVREQANKIASLLKAELWFVSAQTGENVNELFNRVAALSFNQCILGEIQKIKFETSTLGACLKEKILQHQKEIWLQSSKFIKITKKKEGDDRRSKCVNVHCVIK